VSLPERLALAMIKVEKHNAHGLNLVVTLSKSEADNLIALLVNATQLRDKNYIELKCLFEDDNDRFESCELDFKVEPETVFDRIDSNRALKEFQEKYGR
jgi:hypothetical protein